MSPLTSERLREIVSYDPETGLFIRLRALRASVRWEGKRAGWVNALGYRLMNIEGRAYLEHRLAWLYVTGAWPRDLLDHIDGDPTNNSFCNLREATKSTNGANRGKQVNNTTGFKGVKKHRRKWIAQIHIRGRNTYLGIFDSPEAAAEAYRKAAEIEYGEFARTG